MISGRLHLVGFILPVATAACSGNGGNAACSSLPPVCGDRLCVLEAPVTPATLPAEQMVCSGVDVRIIDDCGCDGKTCPAGQRCVQVIEPEPFGGGPNGPANRCFTPCTAATDCGPSAVCLPNTYGVFECRPPQ